MKREVEVLAFLTITFFVMDSTIGRAISLWINNLRSEVWAEALIQGTVVALTILGGLWVNRKIENEKLIREIIGGLDAITSEIGYNLIAANLIKGSIQARPSLIKRSKFSSIDELLKYCKDEEEYIARYAGQLTDKAYFVSLPTVFKISNRQLLEDIINEYTKLKNIKFVIQLRSMDGPTGFSEDEKRDILGINDRSFDLWVSKLDELKESLTDLDNKVRAEIRILKRKIKL